MACCLAQSKRNFSRVCIKSEKRVAEGLYAPGLDTHSGMLSFDCKGASCREVSGAGSMVRVVSMAVRLAT